MGRFAAADAEEEEVEGEGETIGGVRAAAAAVVALADGVECLWSGAPRDAAVEDTGVDAVDAADDDGCATAMPPERDTTGVESEAVDCAADEGVAAADGCCGGGLVFEVSRLVRPYSSSSSSLK